MAQVSLKKLVKRYGALEIVHGIDLDIADKEFIALVGPSGCGKSTTLRMVAGLEPISGGDIEIGGRVVNDLPPRDRNISMVFQSYALYPHMSVRENMGFSLKIAKVPQPEIDQRVNEAAAILSLEALMDRRPAQLSGGQRQRVAMGRAIVRNPEVFLFDEPLSNLDAKLRVDMRAEIKRLHMRTGVTTIYVTHDQVEAMTLGTRIAVLDAGRIQQLATPLEIYTRPANRFVATFIGSPSINLFDATRDAAGLLRLPDGVAIGELANEPAGKVAVGVRPEDMSLRDDGQLAGRISLVEPTGPETYALVDLGHTEVTVRMSGLPNVLPGAEVRVHVPPQALHVFASETGERLN